MKDVFFRNNKLTDKGQTLMAEAFHDALIRRGAAGPLKDRVDLMRVRDANARHLAFVA